MTPLLILARSIRYLIGKTRCAIRTDIDDTSPSTRSFNVTPCVFRHHQSNGPTVDSKMLVMACGSDGRDSITGGSKIFRAEQSFAEQTCPRSHNRRY